jgi:alpha-beta hydrolase superfamily lysophospholipase
LFPLESQEFNITNSEQGKQLFARLWEVENSKMLICLVHGQGEHSGRYLNVANYFISQSFSVMAIDLQGHGKSDGKRGHILKLDEYLGNVGALMKEANNRFPKLTKVIYGHSMGGNVVANYILKNQNANLQGIVLTSPWFKLAFEPPIFKVMLAKLVRNIMPSYTEKNSLDGQGLSRDEAVGRAYVSDELVHGDISASAFWALSQGGETVIENAHLFSKPTLVMHGMADSITSHKATQEFAEKNKQFIHFKGWENHLHELHNELDYEEKLQFIADWLRKEVMEK